MRPTNHRSVFQSKRPTNHRSVLQNMHDQSPTKHKGVLCLFLWIVLMSRSWLWVLMVVHLQTSHGRLHSRYKSLAGVCLPSFPYPYSGEGKLGAYCCASKVPLNAPSCPKNLFVACPGLPNGPCSSAALDEEGDAEHLWIMETLSTSQFCGAVPLFNGMSSSFRFCQTCCEHEPECKYISYW